MTRGILDVVPVLVVDDEPDERTLLVIALTRAGLPVIEAA
jgi:CheY-like chemotaxis protein